jgi:competence protein ComEC
MRKKRAKNKIIILIQAVVILAAALLSIVELPKIFDNGLTLYVFDVGQADSFLFHFPNGANVLIDAGGRKTGPVLVSRLRRLGIDKIDIAVDSHPHEDHIGGMNDVLDAFDVGRFWDSGYNHGSEIQRSLLETVRDKKISFERPKAGFRESVGDASIEVLAPVKSISGTESDANNNSIVIRIVYGDVSFLMTGDMQSEERRSVGKFPRSTALKIAHHGSSNGTDQKMLREVSPDIVIFTYGRNNSYGHPHKRVIELVEKSGAEIYAAADGEVRIKTDGRTCTVER